MRCDRNQRDCLLGIMVFLTPGDLASAAVPSGVLPGWTRPPRHHIGSGFPISRRSAAVARLMCLRLAASTASIGMRTRWSALPRRRLVLTSTMQRIPASLRQTMSSSPSLPGARQFLQRMSYPAFWRKFAAAVSPACPTLHARVLSLRIRLGRSFPAAFASLLNIAPMMRIYSACPPDGKYWSG